MMRPSLHRGGAVLGYLSLAVLFAFGASRVWATVETGNRRFSRGDVEGAAAAYAAALGRGDGAGIPSYNLGTALLTLGSSEAEEHLLRATRSQEVEVARLAHYNLGVGLLREADPELDPTSATLLIGEAIRHNRAALRIDPGNEAARWNLAIALHMRRSLAPVVEEAPVEDPEGEAEIVPDEPRDSTSRAAAAGAGEESTTAPEADDPGDPEGPRTGVRESRAGTDPGTLSDAEVQRLLDSQPDDTEKLIRGILWSRRPFPAGDDGAAAGRW